MAPKKTQGDVEKGEKEPLLGHHGGKGLDDDDKQQITRMQDIGEGSSGNAKFKLAVQMTVRTAFFACVVGSVIWVPFIRKPFPDGLQGYMGLAALLYIFTINAVLGQTISNALTGTLGTWLACVHMWVMQGIFPGGMDPTMSPVGMVAIFGWVNFVGFAWFILWSKSSIGLKMFALSYDVGFMLDFLNPNSAATYSEGFKISSSGIAVNCMIATLIAVFLAVLNNLIPWVQTSAYSSMKDGAHKAGHDMAQLVEVLVDYYSGDGPSIVIESAKKHAADMRSQLDGLGGAIGAGYFEGFDIGTKGTIRKLTESHLAMLNTTYDRVKAILIALQSEDFSESHQTIMAAITPASRNLALVVQTLLVQVTDAMSDGDVSPSEKDDLRVKIQDAKDAVAKLSQEFDKVRRTFNSSIHPELLGESFFVLTLSAYARLVWDYSEMVLDNPPPAGAGFFGDMANCIKSTWNWADLTETYNMNFAIRYTVAMLLGFLYCIEIANWVGTCGVFVSLLISTRVSPDVQATLDTLLAVIVATLTGAIVFDQSCMTGYGDYVLPLAAFCFWNACLYPLYSGSKFGGIGMMAAALGSPRIVKLCPADGDLSNGRAAMWATMVAIMFSIGIIVACESAFAVSRASDLALTSLNSAFKGLQAAFLAFWSQEDIGSAIVPVAGHCSAGDTFNASANIEPRLWRFDWKVELYRDLVESIRRLRLDMLMLEFSMEGGSGSAAGLFDKFASNPEWVKVRSDLDSTLEQARKLSIGLVGHEIGEFHELEDEVSFESDNKLDELEDLPALLQNLALVMKFPAKAPASMEDDEICKVSVVLVMLQATCSHIAHIIHVLLNNA